MFQGRVGQSKYPMSCRIVSGYFFWLYILLVERTLLTQIINCSYCQSGTKSSDPFRNDTTLRPYACTPGTFFLREPAPMKCKRMWWATHNHVQLVSSAKQLRHRRKVMGPARHHFNAQKEQPTHGPLQKDSIPSTLVRLNPPRVCQDSTHLQFKLPSVSSFSFYHVITRELV